MKKIILLIGMCILLVGCTDKSRYTPDIVSYCIEDNQSFDVIGIILEQKASTDVRLTFTYINGTPKNYQVTDTTLGLEVPGGWYLTKKVNSICANYDRNLYLKGGNAEYIIQEPIIKESYTNAGYSVITHYVSKDDFKKIDCNSTVEGMIINVYEYDGDRIFWFCSCYKNECKWEEAP